MAVGAGLCLVLAATVHWSFVLGTAVLLFLAGKRAANRPEGGRSRRSLSGAAGREQPLPVWKAELLAQRGEYQDAIECYRGILDEHKHHIELYNDIAELYFDRLSDYGAAAQAWSTALRLLPTLPEAQRGRLEGQGLGNYWKLRLEDCRRKMRRTEQGLESVDLPASKGRF